MTAVIIASIIISTTAGVIATSLYNRRYNQVKRKLRRAEFKRIQFIQDGETVTVAGNVVFHKRYVQAPLSGRECVYYHVTVERKKSSGKNSHWVKEIDEASCVDFLLDDGESQALIEASAIEGYLEKDALYRSGTFNDATPVMEAFLQKYSFKSTGPFGLNRALRYREGALEKHEYVVVSGQCQWEDAAAHELEGEKVLVIRASKENPVYISDVKDVLVD